MDPDASEFFVTICCQQRGANQPCLPPVADGLLQAARFYYEQRKWCPSPFLLMPDHVHMLVSFGRGHEMTATIAAWKRFTARAHGIGWQRGFFEHRLRHSESAWEKSEYIRQNPVRAGLVANAEDWPYLLRLGE